MSLCKYIISRSFALNNIYGLVKVKRKEKSIHLTHLFKSIKLHNFQDVLNIKFTRFSRYTKH